MVIVVLKMNKQKKLKYKTNQTDFNFFCYKNEFDKFLHCVRHLLRWKGSQQLEQLHHDVIGGGRRQVNPDAVGIEKLFAQSSSENVDKTSRGRSSQVQETSREGINPLKNDL